MNYLKKVILVNSWGNGKGKFKVFDVDEGTLLQGGNGVGKTSTLILPLLFFGARPVEVMKASKKPKDNFIHRYLPFDSSYIVFEYVKNGENKLVIVQSHDRERVRYLFADTGFDERLFLDEKNRFVKAEDLRGHVRREFGVTVYRRLFNTSEYREVIQSAKRLSKSNKASKDVNAINEAKERFSLCENNESIAGAEKVAVSIISSSPSFASIKELIAQEIEVFDSGVQEQLVREQNVSELQKQATIIRQAKGFSSHKSKVQSLRSLSISLASMEKDLGRLKYQSEQRLQQQQKDASEIQETLNNKQEHYQTLDVQYQKMMSELNQAISESEGNLTDAKRRIELLTKKHADYEKGNIDQKRRKAASIERLDTEIQGLRAQHDALKGAFAEIDSLYARQIDELNAEVRTAIDRERERYNTEKLKEVESRTELASEQADRLGSIDNHYHENLKRIKDERHQTELQVVALKEKSANPNNQETERLDAEEREVSQSLSNKYSDRSQSQERYNQQSNELNSVERVISELSLKRDQTNSKLSDIRGVIQDCEESLKHVDSMLYFKLYEQSPEKAMLACRALNISLLKSPVDDLNKIHDDNSLLGFDIDFSKIQPQPILDKEELESQLAKHLSQEQQLVERLAQLAEQKSEKERQAKQCFESKDQESLNIEQISREIKQLEKRLGQTQTDKRSEKRKLAIQYRDEIERQNELLANLTENEKQVVQENDANRESVKQDIQARREASIEKVGHLKQAFDNFISEQTINLNKKVDELQRKRRRDLSEKGARVEEIAHCEASLNNVKNEKSQAEQAQREYAKYTYWYEAEYSRLPEWKKKAKEWEAELMGLTAKRKDAIESHKVSERQYLDDKAGLERKLQFANQEIAVIKSLAQAYLSDIISIETTNAPPPADKIRSAVKLIKKEAEENEKEGKQTFRNVMSALRQYGELFELCKELLVQNGFEDFDTAQNWKVLSISLSHLMDGTLVEHINTIRQSFSIKSQELVSLHEKLLETESRIASKGREISKQFNASGTRFENIEGLEVKVTSSLKRLPFMKSLSKAVDAFHEAKLLADYESPSDSYFDVIATAVKDLAQQNVRVDISQFIEIAVRVKNTNSDKWRLAINDQELEGISSEGLSFLILISLYAAIKNVIQKNYSAWLLWSVDEIGRLHPDNAQELKRILAKEKIALFGATPKADPKVVEVFNHFYEIKPKGIHKFIQSQRVTANEALFGQQLSSGVQTV